MQELVPRDGVRMAAVCDILAVHKERAKALSGAEVCHRWEDVVARTDIDAVVVGAPDHLHAPIAIAAMRNGKDVYCEPPMGLTASEAKTFRNTALETGRIVQIGARETSEGRWRAARDLIRQGRAGRIVWLQADSSPRNIGSTSRMRLHVRPDTLDWPAFLGPARHRPFDAARYLRWRDYWDYSGGIATDLFFRQLAPLLLATESEFPQCASAAGGIYTSGERETPDSLVMTLEYAGGHTIALASPSPCPTALPAVIRGECASIECEPDRLTVRDERHPQRMREVVEPPPRAGHLDNWLQCVRSREKCVCDEQLGYRTTVALAMGIQAYRERRTLTWDAATKTVATAAART